MENVKEIIKQWKYILQNIFKRNIVFHIIMPSCKGEGILKSGLSLFFVISLEIFFDVHILGLGHFKFVSVFPSARLSVCANFSFPINFRNYERIPFNYMSFKRELLGLQSLLVIFVKVKF